MKKIFTAIALCAGLIQPSFAADALKAAIANPQRTASNVERDAARHPYETLTFFGIKPKMTVVEISPGGGWYTEILAPYLKQHGKLIVGISDPESKNENARRGYARFKQKLDDNPSMYSKVGIGIFEPSSNKINYAPNNSVDVVLTFRNIHNWIQFGDSTMDAVFKTAFNSLKRGGVFGVVEHRLPESVTQTEKADTGYVHQSYVIKMAEKAGFKLAAKSEINANPKDDADHENGVWALPPVLTNKEKDVEKYLAIGESDRMTLKFVKP